MKNNNATNDPWVFWRLAHRITFDGHPIAVLVMRYLVSHADEHGKCWPSYALISTMCGGISRSSIAKSIQLLRELGILIVVTKGHGNQYGQDNKANIYQFHEAAMTQLIKQQPLFEAATGKRLTANKDLLSQETRDKLLRSLSGTTAERRATLSTETLTTNKQLPGKEVVAEERPPEGAGTTAKGIYPSVPPLRSLREHTKSDGILAPPLPDAAIKLADLLAAHAGMEADIDHAIKLTPLFQSDKSHEKEILAAAEWTTKDPWWSTRINTNMFAARYFATILGQYRASKKKVGSKPKVAPPKAAGLYNPDFDMGDAK